MNPKANSLPVAVVALLLLTVLPGVARGAEQTLCATAQKVENDGAASKTVTLATGRYVPESSQYAVRGRVRYSGVAGEAYLEMWNIMPDGSRYFSRTLAPSGPMGIISGDSDWRGFLLPFNLMETRPTHVDLEINVVMPGKGTIEVSPIAIGPGSGSGVVAAASKQAWFTETDAGRWGGIGGGVYGTVAGLFGALCGWLAPRGRGRRLILGGIVAGAALGLVLLAIGLYAWLDGQPRYVGYMFALPGVLTLIIFPLMFSRIKRRYGEAELRKMSARDAYPAVDTRILK